jgi:predicted secreted protein
MTQGQKAFGSKIWIGDGASPEVFTKIDEVFSIGPVGGTKELVDMTNHDTLSYYDYLVFDLKDGKEIKIEANDISGNASHALVRAAEANSTKPNWKIVLRDGAYVIFPGVITDIDDLDPSDMKGKVVFRFTIKIAGTVVRTNPT